MARAFSVLVLAVGLVVLPAVSQAITTITIEDVTLEQASTSLTTPLNLLPQGQTTGTFGNFTISSATAGRLPRLFAEDGLTVDKLTLTDLLITAGSGSDLTLDIFFSSTDYGVLNDATYPYGVITAGAFSTTGDRIVVSGFVDDGGDGTNLINQFTPPTDSTFEFTSAGAALSFNRRELENIFCSNDFDSETEADRCAPELSGWISITFSAPGDVFRLPGSFTFLTATNQADFDREYNSIDVAAPPTLAVLGSGLLAMSLLGLHARRRRTAR
jgi:hypothetical protein